MEIREGILWYVKKLSSERQQQIEMSQGERACLARKAVSWTE
jgi:hypothetical protein